jgi:hypothetical protein
LRIALLQLAVLATSVALRASAAWSFPPYRSTDAETADPGVVEVRLGLTRVEREAHDSHYASPLARVNLGVVENLELVSELEYLPEEGHLGDGALGVKGVAPLGPLRVGVETLALLPSSSGQSGVGVESQLLASWRRGPVDLHVNAGGFHDPRPDEIERGWRASILAELERGRARPGLEAFARQVHGESVAVQAGPGVILDVGAVDLRAALHVGLTREASDLVGSLWITWKWRLLGRAKARPPDGPPVQRRARPADDPGA